MRWRRVSSWVAAMGTVALTVSMSSQRTGVDLPSNFPPPVYNLSENPITDKGFDLGKRLFYDGRLSRDGIVSCGFCHQQPSAFTHHGHDLSHGVEGRLGRRNAPSIVNVIWQKTFFWDGGVNHLEFVPLNAIENENEMGETLQGVIAKLNSIETYRKDFKEAYGIDEITSTAFLKSLAQYTSSLISANSRYDRYVRGEGELLTNEEMEGMQLFRTKCNSCHATDLFTDGSYRNNGITDDFRFDKGREEVTLNAADRGKFKVPTLRNIEYTDPYFHDGSAGSLEAVLQHYASGVKATPTLDPILQNGGRVGIEMSDTDQKKIIAFLKTLTDQQFLHDKRFSEY